MNNQLRYKAAVEAIEFLFSDTSVSLEKTIENLDNLQGDIEAKIECLKEDMAREASENV
jgi:hypothetical protein